MNEFEKTFVCIGGSKRLNEYIGDTLPTDEEIRNNLANPNILPDNFDYTFEAWLMRINMWGKIEITHKDANKKKSTVTQKQFLKRISDNELSKFFGKWEMERLDINKMRFYLDYLGVDLKPVREEFIITVKLKPELKKALRKW